MKRQPGKVVPLHPGSSAQGRESHELALRWFKLHREDLLRYGRRVLPASESAEDLVQDVFDRILRHSDLEMTRNPRALLMTIARNAAIDRLRKMNAMPEMVDRDDISSPAPHGMDEVAMAVAIERAIAGLPERTREVFVLRRFRGLESNEVASHLGISVRMVQKHLARSMSLLQESLPGRTTESHDGR